MVFKVIRDVFKEGAGVFGTRKQASVSVLRVYREDPWYDDDNGLRVKLSDGRVCRQLKGIANWAASRDGGENWSEIDKLDKAGGDVIYDVIAPAVRDFKAWGRGSRAPR